jgi:hypothetical protein
MVGSNTVNCSRAGAFGLCPEHFTAVCQGKSLRKHLEKLTTVLKTCAHCKNE